ncbi:MAG: endonuclease domain-containing protein [Candidatus Kerfeldbacteria bacterium]|nr:endonuclease domain-containing protein [Candidatus Kerfeldbacteria bacterium]
MPPISNWKILKVRRQDLRRNSTPAERRLWMHLRRRQMLGYKFRRQHSLGRYIVDLYCPSRRLVIEVDGNSHFSVGGQASDRQRDAWFMTRGIHILRFRNDQVLKDTAGVLRAIKVWFNHP